MKSGQFQIGKAGLTSHGIQALDSMLKTHSHVRISVLRSTARTKESMHSLAESIIQQLKTPCNYRIIGFTIILLRLRHSSQK